MKTATHACLSLLAVLALGAAAPADEAKDALAKKARAVLETHCYRCHGKDGKVESGVNVLNRTRLVERKKVVPGKPGKSPLLRAILEGDMPPSGEEPRLGEAERKTLQEWIEADAPDFAPAVAPRVFLANRDIFKLIHDDLQKLRETDRHFARYFTLTHLYNTGLAEDELQGYRHGLAKLVNSLSWGRRLVVPVAVDPARTIFRIDLRDYRWNEKTWLTILARNPYGVVLDTPEAKEACKNTACPLPHVRGDWFVFAASRPPLYHDVLDLPRTDRELEKRLEVDVQENIRQEKVARAGFNGSGVSRNNRLIERHETGYGAYWKSYDFAANNGRRNLFDHPLGPQGANAFQHDGDEIIFNLPNGLQAYLLVNQKGERLDEAPVKIVSIKSRPDPTVINGISCMTCHNQGMIAKADQVRKLLDGANPFTKEETETIKALYPPAEKFADLLREDAARFKKAVELTGDHLQKTDTVVLLAARFEEEMDLTLAAAEAGLKTSELLDGLKTFAKLGRVLGPLKVGGTVQRDVFVQAFPDLVRELKLGTFLPPGGGTPVVRPDKPIINGIGMKLVPIAPGTFTVGSPEKEHKREDNETPHKVTLTKGFHMGATLVTQKQWQEVMGNNPSKFSGDDLPVDSVTWFDAVEFCIKLSAKEDNKPRYKLTNVKRKGLIESADVEILAEGTGYRLPTEAEWEFACRAGTTTPFWVGETITTDDANFSGNSPYRDTDKTGEYRQKTTPVTQFKANPWGLHDMGGNVWQWCQDYYGEYPKAEINDPQGPKSGELRVLRGGAWYNSAEYCRAASRSRHAPAHRDLSVGFRVVLPRTD